MNKTFHEIKPVKDSVTHDILKREGVTGVGIGYKYTDGKKTDELSIRVYVEKKKDRVEKGEKIPPEIDGVKTDVIERKFVLQPMRVAVKEIEIQSDTGRYDPLKGGISIGPCRVVNGYIYVGTLGIKVTDNATGNAMLLSNFHVMCIDNQWHAGDTMAQPGRVDGGNCPGDVVGTLQRAVLNDRVDCAVSSSTVRKSLCEVMDVGQINGTEAASLNMPVRKRGRTTGLTYGNVDDVDLTTSIDYGDGLGTVTLHHQIGVQVDASRSSKFGDHGDSGSVVVSDSNKVVGLHFAGSTDGTSGVANPIQEVLTALNVSLCTQGIIKSPFKEQLKDHKEWKFEIKEVKEFKEFHHEVKVHKPEKSEVELKDLSSETFKGPGEETVQPVQPIEPIQPVQPLQPIKPPFGQAAIKRKEIDKEFLKNEKETFKSEKEFIKNENKEHKSEWKELKDKEKEGKEHKDKDKDKDWKEKNDNKDRKDSKEELKSEHKDFAKEKESLIKEHKPEKVEVEVKDFSTETLQPPGPIGPIEQPFGQAATKSKETFKSEKEFIKNEKETFKSEKEFIKNENKEHKPEWKEHKIEWKEHKPEWKEHKIEWKEHKPEWKESSKIETNENPPFDPSQPPIQHFIGKDQRPDLSMGALRQEPDQQALSQKLKKAADEAKQAKDDKDVKDTKESEKYSER